MISGFNTWNPEVQSPPTTRIQVPPAFVISFKSPFIQFECWRLLYDKFFFYFKNKKDCKGGHKSPFVEFLRIF
jgi:hypothetical protein